MVLERTDLLDQKDILVQYNDELINELNELNENNPFGKFLLSEVGKGKNSVVSKILQESKIFDATWVDTLESYFPSLDRIVRNPRSSIMNVTEVVAAERAKKITSESVRHLAAHTEYIREVNEVKNEVTPSKILTTFREQDMGIYENRFIKTLINRLYLFIHKRYDIVKDSYESFSRNILEVSSDFETNGEAVKYNVQLDIKTGVGNEKLNAKNLELVKRIEKLALLVTGYKISPFMQEMAKEREILPPVMKTNIILKNQDFRNCYLMWLFIDRYTSIGYDVSTKEKKLEVTDSYKDQLLNLVMMTYVSNQAYNPNRDLSYDDEDFKEKILKRLRQKNKGELKASLKPEDIILENTIISEYFLKEATKMFNKSYEELLENGDLPSAALKKVVQQMLNVVNRVYKNMFEIPEEHRDIFQQYLETSKQTDEEAVKEYKQKVRILKDVIAVKEADLKKTKQEMQRMEKNLAKHQEAIAKAKAKEEARRKALEAKEKARREAEIAKQKAKEEAQRAKEAEKARIAAEKEKARLEAIKAKEAEKARIAAEKEKARQKALAEKEKAKAKEAARIAKEKEAAKKAQEAEKARIKAEKEAARLEAQKAKEAEKARIAAEKEAARIAKEEAAKEKARIAAEKEAARLEKERIKAEKEKARLEAQKAKEEEARRLAEEKAAAEETARLEVERLAELARLEAIRKEQEEKERLERERQEKLRKERELRRMQENSRLMELVRLTKQLAKETEEVAQQTESVLAEDEQLQQQPVEVEEKVITVEEQPTEIIEEQIEKEPIDNTGINSIDLMKIVQETKELAEETHDITEQVEDIAEELTDDSEK